MNVSIRTWVLALLLSMASHRVSHAKIAPFNLPVSKAVLSGYWEQSTDGARIWIGGNNGSQLDASVTGTSVDLTCFSSASTGVTITVDGVAQTPTFSATNVWTTLRIDLGAEGTHALTITQTYLAASFYLDTGTGVVGDRTFTVHGIAPSIGPPASGFGPQYPLSDPVNVTFDIQAEGGLTQTNTGGYPSVYYNPANFADEAVYFTASAVGTIKGWMFCGGGTLGLFVDGVRLGTIPMPLTNTYQWVTLFAGDGSPHRYGVAQSYRGSDGLAIWSLMTVDGALSAVTTPARPRLIAFGDSITAAQMGTTDESSLAYPQRLGEALGWAVYNRGIAASTVRHFASGKPIFTTEAGESRTSDVTSAAAGAKGVVILYGTNDMKGLGGTESISDFQESYRNMLAQIVAGVPATCPILCVGILPRINYSPDTIGGWNAAVQAAIKAVAAPNVNYADSSGWGLMQNNGASADYTDVDGNFEDGLHPNRNGYAIMASHLLPYFAPPGVPVITSADGDAGQVGRALAYQITAANQPTSFDSNELPPGLTLDPATGVISGTPKAAGTFTFAVAATNASGSTTKTLQFTVTVPVVTVAATVPQTAVNEGKGGRITISIPSVQTSDLKVKYAVSGSAAAGTDYLTLNGTAVIVAGHTSRTVRIKPLGNLGGMKEKVVKLKVVPGSDYSVATISPARVKIFAQPLASQ